MTGAPSSLLDAAKDHVGSTYVIPEAMTLPTGTLYTLEIHVHENGGTYTSLSPNAMVVLGDDPHGSDEYICFEDGGGPDWNDLVLHVQRPDLTDDLTLLPPDDYHDGFEVDVKYNALQMVSPTYPQYVTLEQKIAKGIEDRAHMALQQFKALLTPSGGDGAVPPRVEIWVEGDPKFYGIFDKIPGAGTECTTSAPVIKFSVGGMMTRGKEVATYVSTYGSSTSSPPGFTASPGTWLADTIDHELWHAVQCTRIHDLWSDFWRLRFDGDYSNIEGTAQLSEDLITDTDDAGFSGDGSFLSLASEFLAGNVPVDNYATDGRTPYKVAAFYQYLAEHYDSGTSWTLEQRAADFMLQLSTGSEDHLTDVAYAMQKQWPADVLVALRDFYVAAYAHRAPNASALDAIYRIYDETTTHGASASSGAIIPSQTWGGVQVRGRFSTPQTPLAWDPTVDPHTTLSSTAGGVWEIPVNSGTAVVRLTLTASSSSSDVPLIAAIPVDSAGNVLIDSKHLFWVGPRSGGSATYEIPVAATSSVGAADKIALVIVDVPIGPNAHLELSASPTEVGGTPSVTIDQPSDVSASALPGSITVFVHPAFGGTPVTNTPSESFTAEIDGSAVTISSSHYSLLGAEWLSLQIPALSVGTHALKVWLGASFDTKVLTVTASAPSPHVGMPRTGPQVELAGAADGSSWALTLGLDGTTQAGLPIQAHAILLDHGDGLTGGRVVATVTDPSGSVRHFQLLDNGSVADGGAGDGEYGASTTGDNLAGTYTVQVDATGTDHAGNSFALAETATITLTAMADADGDGVSDPMELMLGLNPNNAADGSTDLDGDGLGTAQELALGLDPTNPDTDGGGEPDGSELSAGRNPLSSGDDATVAKPSVGATAQDGRKISVTVLASDNQTPVHLFRISGSSAVDLGVQPGSGATVVDGPLPAGEYRYEAVAQASGGAESLPVYTPTVKALDDATPPTVRMALNGGAAITRQRDVSVNFYDGSETLASMRIATSLDDLTTAPWLPYRAQQNVTLPAGSGPKSVFAQVRDLAGNESSVIARSIDLEPGPIQVDLSAFSAQAVDTDGDGHFEAIRFSGQVDVQYLGAYPISALLTSPGYGIVGTAHAVQVLESGASTIYLDFSGASIVASGQPGPYVVTDLQIGAYDSESDAALLTWATPSYSVSQFVAAPVSQIQGLTNIYPGSISFPVDSTEPYEIWGRFKAVGASSFGSWHQMGTGTPGVSASVTIPQGDGTYEFYSLAISSTTGAREAIPPMADLSVVYDRTAPSSTLVGSVPSRVGVGQLAIAVSSTDSMGINLTCVIHRFRATQDDSWSSWSTWYDQPTTDHCLYGSSGVVNPVLSSPGFYEFMTQAMDTSGNLEPFKTAAQAETHYTTGGDPASHAVALPAYTNQTAFAVPYKADFASGGGTVDLYARFEAKGSSTFGDWAKIATTTYPNQLTAPLTQGDGRYELSTVAIDGQSGQSEARPTNADASVNLDTTPPTTDWRDHPVTPARGPSIQFAAEFSDEASAMAEARFYYRYKASVGQAFGEWKILADSADPSFDCYWPSDLGLTAPVHCQGDVTPVEGDGYYEVSAIGIDKAGNVGAREPAQLAFYLDTTLPTVNVTAPRATKYAYATITYTATDPVGMGSSDLYVQYTPPGGSPGDWNRLYPVSSSPAYAQLNQGPGTYSFFLDACDAAGNCLHDTGADFYAQASIILDTTAPTTSLTSLPAHISSPSQTIACTAEDGSGSGVQTLQVQRQFKGSGGSFGTWSTLSTISDPPSSGTVALTLADGYGTYHLRTIATDYAGNTTTSATTTDTVLDAPILATQAGPLAAAVKSTSLPVPYTVTSGTATSIQLYQRWTTPGGTPSGGYTQVTSKPSPGTSGTFTVTLSKGPGLYEFYTLGVGSSGTESVPASADAFTVLDTTAPTSQASAVTTSRNTNTVPITFAANDNANGSGLASVDLYQRFTAPGGSAGSYSKVVSGATSPVTVTLTAEGKYEFYTLATDKAGNAEAAPSSPDAYTVYDVTAPVSRSTPAAGVHTTTLSVPFTATDANGSGVSSVQLYERYTPLGSTPSGSFTAVGSPATTSPISVILGSVGRYEFYTRATDAAGNVEAAPTSNYATTIYETTAPTSQANGLPALGNSTSLSVPFTANDETNGSGIGSVTLYVSYEAPGSTSWSSYSSIGSPATGTSGSFNVTLTSGSGSYRFYTRATDVAGNTEAAPSTADATTVLDNVAPTSSITAPPSTSSASSISLTYSASDNTNGSGFQSVEFWYRYRTSDGATPGAWTAGGTSPAASGSFTVTFGSGAGIYDVLTVAVDVAGNREGAVAHPPVAGATPKSSVRSVAWVASGKVNTDTGTALQDNAASVVGSDGTLYAVWEDSRNGNTDIYFSSRNPTTGVWAAETKLNTDTGTTGQRTPSIAIDGSGNLYVVWADDRNGATNTDIYFAKRIGTTWSANIKVNSDTATAIQSNPRISVSSAGIAVAVWYDKRSSQTNIYSARLAAGSTTWSTNYNVTTSNTSAVKATPDVAVATDGTAWATWQDNRTGGGDIYVASLGPTATVWSTNTKASDDSTTSGLDKSPRIGLTTANLPVVAWLDGRTTNAQVRVANRTSGGTWNASVGVSDTSAKPATGLALAVKADGGIIVAWDDTRSTSAIWGAQCEAGSGTSSVARCAPAEKWSDQTGASSHPAIVVSPTKVYLGWRDDTAGGGDIRIRLRNPS